jgi:hypothetical protein
MVAQFVDFTHCHLVDTGALAKVNSLFLKNNNMQSQDELSALANSIDMQINKALLSTERKCKKPRRDPWSEQEHFASLHVKYWQLKCAANHNSYNASETLEAIHPLLPKQYYINDNGSHTDQQQLNVWLPKRFAQPFSKNAVSASLC